MKRIGLFLGAGISGSGVYKYNQAMLNAVDAVPREKYSVTVAFADDTWAEQIQPRDCKNIFISPGRIESAFTNAWAYFNLPTTLWRWGSPYLHSTARTFLSEKCDLWIFPSQDYLSYLIPVPALVSVHDLMHRYETRFPEVSANGEYGRREYAFRNICKWAIGIVVDSAVGRDHVIQSYGVEKKRIHALPYVAHESVYSTAARADFDKRYNLPKKYLFYPAQFWEHKNHKGLIKAMARLRSDIPDLRLVLVGAVKNAYEPSLKLAGELGVADRITILGYIPDEDIPEFYRRARALVMPTYFGPTNIPPLEAMALGCPVAVSKIYGMPEQVGDAALMFDPKSEEEISDAILRLWMDDKLCNDLSVKGKARDRNWRQSHFNAVLADILEQALR